MRKSLRVLTIAGVLAIVPVCSAQQAADADLSADTNLREVTCRELLTSTGDEKDFAIVFLHGYLLGASGATTYNTDTLGVITDNFLNSCIDAPNESALTVMAAAYSEED